MASRVVARKYNKDKGHEVIIFTGDRDLYQCADTYVTVVRTLKDGSFEEVTPEVVQERYGVTVDQFVDFICWIVC
jgi:5'-3' exonuclease